VPEIRGVLAEAVLAPEVLRVDSVALIESRLSPAGPSYRDREVLPLAGGATP